ncbi:MAG TPA: antitoxin AF2212-like protein [Anaerolineae bacterium]
MVKTIDAVFDGKVFRPDDPVGLEPNTHVRLTIETAQPVTGEAESFLRIARSLRLDGPQDWAANLETYLYGGEDQHAG